MQIGSRWGKIRKRFSRIDNSLKETGYNRRTRISITSTLRRKKLSIWMAHSSTVEISSLISLTVTITTKDRKKKKLNKVGERVIGCRVSRYKRTSLPQGPLSYFTWMIVSILTNSDKSYSLWTNWNIHGYFLLRNTLEIDASYLVLINTCIGVFLVFNMAGAYLLIRYRFIFV